MGGTSSKETEFHLEHGLRWPGVRQPNCGMCEASFGCFRKASHCQLCGMQVCSACTKMKKILEHGKPLVKSCEACTPSNIVKLIDIPEPKAWHKILSFLSVTNINSVIQTCRLMQLSIPLPFKLIEKWDDLFERPTFISAGAYGSVTKTYCRELQRNVAVKMLKKRNVYSERRWRIIMREIDVHLRMNHEHAVKIIGPKVVQTHAEVFIIMELADQDLFDRIVTTGPVDEDTAKSLTRQLCTFLADLHNKGIVHRDLKPENLLLFNVGGSYQDIVLKVADFGFAKQFKELQSGYKQSTSATMPQRIQNRGSSPTLGKPNLTSCTPCGTYGFAAPELIESSNRTGPCNRKAWLTDTLVTGLDVFAAGVVLHVMITGCEPFPCKSTSSHLRAVKKGLRRDHPIYQGLSRDVLDLMTRMLCYESVERPSILNVLNDPWLVKCANPVCVPSVTKKGQSQSIKLSLQSRGRIAPGGCSPALAVTDEGTIILFDKRRPSMSSTTSYRNGTMTSTPPYDRIYASDDADTCQPASYPIFGIDEEVPDEVCYCVLLN